MSDTPFRYMKNDFIVICITVVVSVLLLESSVVDGFQNPGRQIKSRQMDFDKFHMFSGKKEYHAKKIILSRQSLIVNSGNPICSGPYYQGQIQDTAPAGTFITRVSAVDPNNLAITYSIMDTSLQRFIINPITGDLFTGRNISRHYPDHLDLSRSVIEFVVRATNTAGLTCDSLIRINILITPRPQVLISLYNTTKNTQVPYFTAQVFYFTLNSCSRGAIVGGAVASTANGSSVSYAIADSKAPFTVDYSGNLFLSSDVTPGTTYTFVLEATNSRGTGLATVNVFAACSGGSAGGACNCNNDISCIMNSVYSPSYCGTSGGLGSGNPNAPTWSNSTYSVTITLCSVGSVVGTLTANNSPYTYTVNGNANYAISSSGMVTIAQPVQIGTQSFVVGATNSAGTAYALVTVTATCTGTNAGGGGSAVTYSTGMPSFSQDTYSVTITNCAVGAVVGTIIANNANTYAVIGGSRDYGINYRGNISVLRSPATGVVKTMTIEAINSVGAAYTTVSITANCMDTSGSNTVPQVATSGLAAAPGSSAGVGSTGVAVNSQTPQSPGFGQPNFVFNAGACQPGSTVGTLTAGGNPTYSIAAGGAGFSTDPQTGVITITGPIMTTQAFLVQASAAGTQSFTTVTVNCGGAGGGSNSPSNSNFPFGGAGNGPRFTQQSYTFLPVACGPGVIVGSVSARGGRNLTYTSNGLPYWTVDPLSGLVSSVTSVTSFSVFVVTAQSTTGSATATVTTTSNCPDYFTYTVTSCEPGTVVVPASAVRGFGGNFSYTLSGQGSDSLSLIPRTGSIVSTGPLRSGTFTYVLTAGLDSYTAIITLLVNCGGTSVSFSRREYNFTVNCSPVPVRIGVVRAQASNGESITYSLGAVNNLFYVDPSSGELRTQVAVQTPTNQRFSVGALSASGATATANVNLVTTTIGKCDSIR